MVYFNFLVNILIPEKFKRSYQFKTKVKGVLIIQLIIGFNLFFIGLSFWIVDGQLLESVLNSAIGLLILFSIFTLRFFNSFNTYVGMGLATGYIVVSAFLLLFGGVTSDAPFWFAILLALNITYTNFRQSIFWTIYISIFLSVLFYAQVNGLELNYVQPTFTKKATTLISYFTLLIATTYFYSRIYKRTNDHNLEVIENHKKQLKERDNLMSVVAHDLKSPARRIEGLISIFGTENLTKDQHDIFDRINNTAKESTQLIKDLVEATSYQPNLSVDEINLNALINKLKTSYLPLAEIKDIHIVSHGLRKKILLETSSFQLRRILDNLLSNALKFSPFNSLIEIFCVQTKENTSISIKDYGIGFTEEDKPNMFKMLKKLSAQPTAGESSTGLGLSIIKNLSELIKAKISFTTEIGKGTTFTLLLPNKFPSESVDSQT